MFLYKQIKCQYVLHEVYSYRHLISPSIIEEQDV